MHTDDLSSSSVSDGVVVALSRAFFFRLARVSLTLFLLVGVFSVVFSVVFSIVFFVVFLAVFSIVFFVVLLAVFSTVFFVVFLAVLLAVFVFFFGESSATRPNSTRHSLVEYLYVMMDMIGDHVRG